MQFVKQVDITKKSLLPARIKLLNNKTQQPQDNGRLWLGQWALVMPDACPFCYGVNLAVKKPTTLQNPEEPTCILIQLSY